MDRLVMVGTVSSCASGVMISKLKSVMQNQDEETFRDLSENITSYSQSICISRRICNLTKQL